MSRTKQAKQNQLVLRLFSTSVSLLASDFIPQKGQLGKAVWTYYYIFLFRMRNLISKVKHFHSSIDHSVFTFNIWTAANKSYSRNTCASNDTTLQIYMSSAKWNLGAAKLTFSPFNRFRNSCQDIMSENHRKSFMNITSALSAPTKADLVGAVWVSKCIKNSSDRIKYKCVSWIGRAINYDISTLSSSLCK